MEIQVAQTTRLNKNFRIIQTITFAPTVSRGKQHVNVNRFQLADHGED